MRKISKKTRFEIFKRDSFTCQYCGNKSPDVVLHIDHIEPVSKGGDNEITNLITSCSGCNLGKGAKKLDDNSVIEKQRKQLEELNERRNQLEMMLEWRKGLQKLNDDEVNAVEEIFTRRCGKGFTDSGKNIIRKLLKKHTLQNVLECAETSLNQYLKFENNIYTNESVMKSFNYISRILSMNSKNLSDDEKKLYYIRGILRNRIYVNEIQAMNLLKNSLKNGYPIDRLMEYAKIVRNWTTFREHMEEFVTATIEENEKVCWLCCKYVFDDERYINENEEIEDVRSHKKCHEDWVKWYEEYEKLKAEGKLILPTEEEIKNNPNLSQFVPI